MAIIFADIFPEINKVYEHMLAQNSSTLTFGRTSYCFNPVTDTRSILRVFAGQVHHRNWATNSKLMDEYGEICQNFTDSSQLSRHNKAIVKAVYKNIHAKFIEIIDTTQSNTEKLTKIESDLTKLKTQIELLKGVKNIEKTCPRYIRICGVVIPLNKVPVTPFKKWMDMVQDASYSLQECGEYISRANTTRRKQALNEKINNLCTSATKSINSVKAEMEPYFKQNFPWVTDDYNWGKACLGAMNPIERSSFVFEPDKILGTGNAIHNILTQDGTIRGSSEQYYWTKSFLVDEINAVFVVNGINTNEAAPMLSKDELDKVGKISQIFGVVKAIEQNIASSLIKKAIKENRSSYRVSFSLTNWLDELKKKLLERGIDPDVSVL